VVPLVVYWPTHFALRWWTARRGSAGSTHLRFH
jgi:hypothetical protein